MTTTMRIVDLSNPIPIYSPGRWIHGQPKPERPLIGIFAAENMDSPFGRIAKQIIRCCSATHDIRLLNVFDLERDRYIQDFDAVVIPGGYAPDMMRRHPEMIRLVADAFHAGKALAAICHGGWMPASADVLKGKKATSFFAIKDDMVHAGADFVDAETVVDGNLITARKPDDLPAFMKAVMAKMRA